MTIYTPDNWVIVRFNGDKPHYRVLGGWSGSYLHGSSWRMNSGITRVEQSNETFDINGRTHIAQYFDFYGSSGSVYRCNAECYGLRMNTIGTWNYLETRYLDRVELLDENTDWNSVDWASNEI